MPNSKSVVLYLVNVFPMMLFYLEIFLENKQDLALKKVTFKYEEPFRISIFKSMYKG